MPVRTQVADSVVVAYLSGELDQHAAAPIREEIDARCVDAAAKTLVLDFGGVTFMDSSGVGLVMGRFRLMQSLGGELMLSNLPPSIKRVMRMAGLERLAALDPAPPRRRRAAEPVTGFAAAVGDALAYKPAAAPAAGPTAPAPDDIFGEPETMEEDDNDDEQ